MKDDIKEMNLSEMLFNRDERLLDYITNLQEENERLKQELIKKPRAKMEYDLELEESEEAVKYWQNQCDLRQRTIDKAIEYITSYEAISTIQGLDKIEQNKKLDEKTMNVMVERYLKVHHNLLNILQGEDNE